MKDLLAFLFGMLLKIENSCYQWMENQITLTRFNQLSRRIKFSTISCLCTNWYSLYESPPNIKKLADNLGFNAYYEMLCRSLSSSTHETAIIQGKIA